MTGDGVSSIVAGDTYTVIRGYFNGIGSYQGSGAVVDLATGTYDPTFPILKDVYATIADGSGGWFVAGSAVVNGTQLHNLVRIKADKTIDETFAPNPSSSVYAMVLEGNTLYVGGPFSEIAGQSRNSLAAFDITTGSLLPWNPNMPAGNRIQTLAAGGGNVYVGGQFTSVGGQSRTNIAAINATTGVVTAWNPGVSGTNSTVRDIIVSGNLVYLAGNFTTAAGLTRRNLAAIDATTGVATSWNPNPNSRIETIALSSTSTLYLGGTFTTVGGTAREFLAEVSLSTGALTSWDPNFDDATVYKVIQSGTTLYVAGTFSTVNGLPEANLVAVSTTTGDLLSWDPNPNSWITGMALSGTNFLVVGGDGRNIKFNWRTVNELAIIHNTTGEIFLSEVEVGSGSINYALTHGNTLYIAGAFTEVNGQPRQGLAAFDIPSETLLSWAPETDGEVFALAANGTTVFIGGNFSSVNGTPRTALAAVNATTGNLLPLSHDFDGGQIISLYTTSTLLYAAGNFLSVDGVDRNNIVAITISTGDITTWNPPDTEFEINKVQANADWVIALDSEGQMFVLEATSGNTSSTFEFSDFALSGDLLIRNPNRALTAYNLNTEQDLFWSPDVGDDADGGAAVETVAVTNDKIFVGGNFRSMGLEQREGFGAYDLIGVPNQPPVIQPSVSAVLAGGIITISLTDLISDPDDNLDFITLYTGTTTDQGATANLDDFSFVLTLNYGNIQFTGTDYITVGICDLAGECVEQQLAIEVGGDVIAYNAVSPNGDGKNDIFLLQSIELLPNTANNRVTIFNRWGDVVFAVKDYNNTDRVFKGLNENGKELPSGTYYYKIEFTGNQKTKTGYLSLKR